MGVFCLGVIRFALLGFGFLRRSNTCIHVGVSTFYGLWGGWNN